MLIAPAPRDGEAPAFEERRYSREVQLPVRRLHGRRARAAQLLVQLAARRLPGCTGLGTKLEIDPDLVDPGPLARASATGALVPWAQDADRRVVAARRSSRRSAPRTAGTTTAPVRDLPPEAVEYVLYAAKDEKVVVRYRHERGENTYKATFEGVVTEPRAALPRDRLGLHQDRAREVHGHPAVPDLRRQAAAAGDPGGHDRRRTTSGTSRRCRSRTRSTGRPALGAAPDRARADDRPPAPQGDRRPARASSSTSGSTT